MTATMVVGGAGFLGSHLVDRLLSDDLSVDVVDDLSTGSLSNLSDARAVAQDGALKIHTLDVVIPEFVEVVRLRRPEVLYVISALSPTTCDLAGAVKSFAVVASALEAARQAKVDKVVVTLPAGLLYGEVASRDLPVKEDRPRRPVGVAGVVAVAIIELLEMYRQDHDIEFTALALSTVYGTRQAQENNVVSRFLTARSQSVPAIIYGDGRQTRDLLFVDDAVDAVARSLNRGGGLVLNIGTGQQTSVNDLWSLIGGRGETQRLPKPTHDVSRMALSSSRARLHLGWTAWTSVAEGIGSLL
jgi:UDP-glucose 4-epimerase